MGGGADLHGGRVLSPYERLLNVNYPCLTSRISVYVFIIYVSLYILSETSMGDFFLLVTL